VQINHTWSIGTIVTQKQHVALPFSIIYPPLHKGENRLYMEEEYVNKKIFQNKKAVSAYHIRIDT
jgi:hypothetical protein